MAHTYVVDDLAGFVVGARPPDLSAHPRALLKRNVLDSIACAVGSLDGELIATIREHTGQFSGAATATLVGGGRASVDQAAFFNAVLVRYPDLLDTYLTVGGLCHPADNFGAVLAVAEHVNASGADFLLALAVAYEVQCRFSAQVPVMARGLNHALQLAMSVAAGSAKLLGLDAERTANAIAAAAADNVSVAAVHTEPVSNWKGISPAITGMRAVYTTILAGRGITGPKSLFEGPNGLVQLFDQPIDFNTAERGLTCGRADLPQAVLRTDPRAGHHRRGLGDSGRQRSARRRHRTGDRRGLSERVRHRRWGSVRQQRSSADQGTG